MKKECRSCKHFREGRYCGKLAEEIAVTDFESNVVELVEEGYLSDFLRENFVDEIKEYCKTTGRKSEKEESAEASANEILEVIENKLYKYLLRELKTKRAEFEIDPLDEFYCKYWE